MCGTPPVSPQYPAWAPCMLAGVPGCQGSTLLQLCLSFRNRDFLLSCSSFVVMVVNIIISTLTWLVEPRGGFHMSDDQQWVWTWWNRNDTPQALYFSFAHLQVFLPKYPKLWLNLVYISRPSQVAFSWCQWLLPLLACSLWAIKSMQISENSWDFPWTILWSSENCSQSLGQP